MAKRDAAVADSKRRRAEAADSKADRDEGGTSGQAGHPDLTPDARADLKKRQELEDQADDLVERMLDLEERIDKREDIAGDLSVTRGDTTEEILDIEAKISDIEAKILDIDAKWMILDDRSNRATQDRFDNAIKLQGDQEDQAEWKERVATVVADKAALVVEEEPGGHINPGEISSAKGSNFEDSARQASRADKYGQPPARASNTATATATALKWIGAIVLAVLAVWWINGQRNDAKDKGFAQGQDWTLIYNQCVRRNEEDWERHYGRPKDLMSELEAQGIAYVCRNYADRQTGR